MGAHVSPGRAFGSPKFRVWPTFTLEGSFGGILIMDNLKKQHVIVIDQCCMCKKSGEKIAYEL